MKKARYLRGRMANGFYNFTEGLALAFTRRRPPEDVKVVKGLKYGDGKREGYRLIYGEDRSVKQPLMIYVHGGGFVSGLLDLRDAYCIEFAKRGFFVASIDYEYAPKAVFPTQLRQCFKAIEKVLDNANGFNVDTSKILLAGESAGAFFVYYIAAVAKDRSLYDKLGIDFKYRDAFDVTAAISICGVSDLHRAIDTKFPDIKLMVNCFTDASLDDLRNKKEDEKIKLLSPPVDGNVPPSVLIYATHDALRGETLYLKEKLDEHGVPNVLLKADGVISAHAWAIMPLFKKSRLLLDETEKFLKPLFE